MRERELIKSEYAQVVSIKMPDLVRRNIKQTRLVVTMEENQIVVVSRKIKKIFGSCNSNEQFLDHSINFKTTLT